MSHFDGHYRHCDATLCWDDEGITLARAGEEKAVHAVWSEVLGARQIGGRPGFVQLLVRNHVPPASLGHDPFCVPIASDADAKRLVTSIAWRADPVNEPVNARSRRRRKP
jgi:hypothetical protein